MSISLLGGVYGRRHRPLTKTVITNLATNPGYEIGTGSITSAFSDYAAGVETVAPISGTRSFLTTRGGTISGNVISGILCSTGAVRIPVTVGVPIYGAASVKTDQANAIIKTRCNWYDASTVLTAGPETTRVASAIAGQVYRVSEVGIPPPTTVTAYLRINIYTSGAAVVGGEKAWADQLMIVNNYSGPDIAYADGNSPGWAWNGSPDASSSFGPIILA